MKKICLLLFAFAAFQLSIAQQRPAGFELYQEELSALPLTELATFDHAQLWAEDSQMERQGGRTNIGRLIPYTENCYTTGVWSQLPNGDRLWQWRFKTANAKGLCVYFDNFQIPLGSSVFLYPADRSHFFGPAINEDCNEHGKFMMGEIAGEEAILEYYQPFEVIGEPTIEMHSVSHMYRNVFAGLEERGGGSDVCEVDVNCPEGADWVDQRQAVVRLLITEGGSQGLCSGTFVNNVSQDCRKFILTALHCGVSTTDSEWLLCQVRFNYQRQPDENTGATGCGSGNAPTNQNRVGVIHHADSNDGGGNSGSDFLLLELEDEVPVSYNLYYAGWDARSVTPVSGVGIHHPSGDTKKISTTNFIVSGGWQINGTHWNVTWSETQTNWGVTEGGSSGSPLFNQDKRMVGQLTGGGSFCNNPSAPDSYGKFNRNWSGNPNAADQKLKVWLDPNNTGIEFLDGSYLVPGGAYPCASVGQSDEMSMSFSDVSVFPSIGNGHINVSFPDRVKLSSVSVYDQNGRQVYSLNKSMSSPQMLNLDSLESGVYFITIQSESAHSVTKKIQIIH